MWDIEYFKEEEVRCKCGCGGLPPIEFMRRLDRMRFGVGFPFVISSGFRCPTYNASVSKSGLNGPHTIGAVDIAVWGTKAYVIAGSALCYGMTGVGVKQTGSFERRFIHLDDIGPGDVHHPRPWIWSY